MLKRNSKALAIVMTFVFCMSFLAPGFIAAPVAQAASIEYSGINIPTYSTSSTTPQATAARMMIEISDMIIFNTGDNILTVQLPSNVEFRNGAAVSTDDSAVDVQYSGDADFATSVTSDTSDNEVTADIKSSKVVDIHVNIGTAFSDDNAKFIVTFENLYVKSGTGDLNVTLIGPSGSVFPTGTCKIATIAGSGTTLTKAGTAAAFGEDGGQIDGITIAELSTDVIQEGDEIVLKLNKGFTWDSAHIAVGGGWAFDGLNNFLDLNLPAANGGRADFSVDVDGEELTLTINSLPVERTSAGRITIGTDGFGALSDLPGELYPIINVEDTAKLGDVVVSVTCDNDNVAEDEFTVASYGDYATTVVADTTEDVISGRDTQEIGNFFIEEGIAGSIVADRSIQLTLPSGCKWVNKPDIDYEDGDIVINDFVDVTGSSEKSIKASVESLSTETSKIKISGGEIKIAPDFEGDVTLTVAGSAGVKGTVVVAKAVKPVSFMAEGATKLVIGSMKQKAGNIVITENVKEAIMDTEFNNVLQINLPSGVTFASDPKVEVTAGDLEIDEVINNDNSLKITIDSSSSKASTITISDVYLTVDRTVPEGNVKATFEALDDFDTETDADGNDVDVVYGDTTGSTALVEWASDAPIGNVVIAEIVTPAAGARAVEFRINSNIYTVNGLSQVMDVAPYIKAGRTYVPLRYLGLALGVAEGDIVWDATAQTATLTLGTTVVVFTIGSTTYTINGEAKTMDVAPEITNGRTMFPARYVAEGLGYVVGWDASTATVLVSK